MPKRALVQVMPSTACNARCPYCYEEGHHARSMNGDVLLATINFVKTLLDKYENVSLVWFGGEPLLFTGIIE